MQYFPLAVLSYVFILIHPNPNNSTATGRCIAQIHQSVPSCLSRLPIYLYVYNSRNGHSNM